MKTIDEIRLENLAALIAEKGTQEAVADAGGTSSVYLSQIKNRTPDKKTGKLRQMGDDMARKLEEGCNKERGWMDNIHSAPLTYSTTAPVVAMVAAEPRLALQFQDRFDVWTRAAIEILQKLDMGQRQAMVARMREYQQYLEPPVSAKLYKWPIDNKGPRGKKQNSNPVQSQLKIVGNSAPIR